MCSPFRSEARRRWPRELRGAALLAAAALALACGKGPYDRSRADRPARIAPVPTAAAPQNPAPTGGPSELRVCADPNNLPFSNDREEGFENRLAELVAADMGASVRYTWWAQRRGFIRNTLRALDCDVVMGVPSSFELVLATRPYYRSSYVFLSRADRHLAVRSLDDEILKRLDIGVHIIGDDYANPPPAHALAARGIIRNVAGYSIFGDYSQPNPPARLVEAVVAGDIDVAVIWGPFAGYFGARQLVPLDIVPVAPELDRAFLPMAFDISMGVRHDDEPLRDRLNGILERRRADLEGLLAEFHIPTVPHRRQIATAGGPR